MKQAILVIAYKNFIYLNEIINHFNDCFDFYIHIDKKTFLSEQDRELLHKNPRIKFISQKYKIYWGGWNILRVLLFLSEEALKDSTITRIHSISGADYPLKSSEYFENFFTKNKNKQYIENFRLPTAKWTEGGLNRLEYYYLYDIINLRTAKRYKFQEQFLKFQKKLKFKRTLSHDIWPLYGGGCWWSLSRECLQYIIEYTQHNPRFLKRLRYTFAPEEIYFQTIIMHSKFEKNVVNDYLRYIIWQYRNKNYPANLDITDLKPILLSDKLFARKIEFPISTELVEKLKYIQQQTLIIPKKISDKKEILRLIAAYFLKYGQTCIFNGLYYGKLGLGIFLFHYSRFVKNERYAEKAIEFIKQTKDALEQHFELYYADGLLGIGSGIEYLYVHGFLEGDSNEILEDVDKIVCVLMEKTVNESDITELNRIYNLGNYLKWRAKNRNIKESILFSNLPKQLQNQISSTLSVQNEIKKTSVKEYIQQIHNTYHMGLMNGLAGIGLHILSELSPTENAYWEELL